MLANIFLKTLRGYLVAILVMGGLLAIAMYSSVVAYTTLFRGDDRVKMLADAQNVLIAFTFLIGKIYNLDTLGGYTTTRLMGSWTIFLSIFALLAGSAVLRGDEEKGILEFILSTPHSRMSILLQKWGGVGLATLLIALIDCLSLLVAAKVTGQSIDPGGAFVEHLNMGLVAFSFASLAILASQLTTRRGAAGWSGVALAATFVMNNLAQTVPRLHWLSYLSPFHYYSHTLAREVFNDWIGTFILLMISVFFVAGAIILYQRRDHYSYFRFPQQGRSKGEENSQKRGGAAVVSPRSFWLRNDFTFGLRNSLGGILTWGIPIGAFNVMMVSLLNSIRDGMVGMMSNNLYKQLGFQVSANSGYLLHLIIFLFILAVYSAYAVAQIGSWTSEETEGRLELFLSTPSPRWRVMLTHFLILLISSALTVSVGGIAFNLAARWSDISVDWGKQFAAFFGLWVICLVIISGGFAVSAFKPALAVVIVGSLVAVSYLIELMGGLLSLPDWVVRFSIFHAYGQPIVHGVDWTAELTMMGISLGLIILGVFCFQRRDITR